MIEEAKNGVIRKFIHEQAEGGSMGSGTIFLPQTGTKLRSSPNR